jgi:hypothetical protein
MKTYKMIKAGEESTITEAEAIEIIGAENFEVAKEGLSWQQDDVEIFFSEQLYRQVCRDIPEQDNEDIDDYGAAPCCPEGRMRYHGGSRYFCDFCGKDQIRPTGDFVKFQE